MPVLPLSNDYIAADMVPGFTVETLPIKTFNSLRYGCTPAIASVAVVFVLLAVSIFDLIGRFGDLPKLLGAMNPGKIKNLFFTNYSN